MPRVSILIPSYRPDYFDACIASALAQTFRDVEIIVSDDCPTDAIRQILAKWDDPRIRYERNPAPDRSGSNRDNLLRLARGRYLKFLWDDDLLYPRSVELLLDAMEHSGAGLAFHHRHFIDTAGRVLAAPTFVPAGQAVVVPPEAIYRHLIGRRLNLIGEPTNIMVDAQALRALDRPFAIEGRPSRFLTDMALYYNLTRAGFPIAGVGIFAAGFRQHGGQSSGALTPDYAAGVFEWELLARSARAARLLPAAEYAGALALLHGDYRRLLGRLPVFGSFLRLPAAQTPAEALSPAFFETLDLAYADLALRALDSIAAAA